MVILPFLEIKYKKHKKTKMVIVTIFNWNGNS